MNRYAEQVQRVVIRSLKALANVQSLMLLPMLLVAPQPLLATTTPAATYQANTSQKLQWQPTEIIRLDAAVTLQLWRHPALPGEPSWLFQIERHYAGRNLSAVRCLPVCDITQLAQPSLLFATNAGFFTQSSPRHTSLVSALVSDRQFIAHNIGHVTRNRRVVPVERAFLAVSSSPDAQFSSGWTTALQPDEQHLRYSQCMPAPQDEPNIENTSFCLKTLPLNKVQFAVGGGPMLLRLGEKVDSFAAEQMPGSGVEWWAERPRTAIAHNDAHLMMLITPKASLPQLQDMLKQAGASTALNLDGGSSSVLAIGEQVTYSQGRSLPAFLVLYRQP